VPIGFDSVAALSAGRLDAATAFWNAEGVTLRRLGVPTREFRVDSYGAPRYPELVLTTTAQTLAERPELVAAVVAATGRGYDEVVADPGHGLDALVAAVPELDRGEQRAQLDALLEARALGPGLEFDRAALDAWATPAGPTSARPRRGPRGRRGRSAHPRFPARRAAPACP
jgi:ABC-type nitrate/sulfonate/bicarbonate transport system substrate-binding protein